MEPSVRLAAGAGREQVGFDLTREEQGWRKGDGGEL